MKVKNRVVRSRGPQSTGPGLIPRRMVFSAGNFGELIREGRGGNYRAFRRKGCYALDGRRWRAGDGACAVVVCEPRQRRQACSQGEHSADAFAADRATQICARGYKSWVEYVAEAGPLAMRSRRHTAKGFINGCVAERATRDPAQPTAGSYAVGGSRGRGVRQRLS